MRLTGVSVLVPSSYKRHSFINNSSSKCVCFQRARRSLENRRFTHCVSYSPFALPHPRAMILPSPPFSWLQEIDQYKLHYPECLTLAPRQKLPARDWRGEGRGVDILELTPISYLSQSCLELDLHLQFHGHWFSLGPRTLLPPSFLLAQRQCWLPPLLPVECFAITWGVP